MDFTPRPVFFALQNTNALFSDTRFDRRSKSKSGHAALRRQTGFPFLSFGFPRDRESHRGVLACRTQSAGGRVSTLVRGSLIEEYGYTHPVLVDVTTGEIKQVEWKSGQQTH